MASRSRGARRGPADFGRASGRASPCHPLGLLRCTSRVAQHGDPLTAHEETLRKTRPHATRALPAPALAAHFSPFHGARRTSRAAHVVLSRAAEARGEHAPHASPSLCRVIAATRCQIQCPCQRGAHVPPWLGGPCGSPTPPGALSTPGALWQQTRLNCRNLRLNRLARRSRTPAVTFVAWRSACSPARLRVRLDR